MKTIYKLKKVINNSKINNNTEWFVQEKEGEFILTHNAFNSMEFEDEVDAEYYLPICERKLNTKLKIVKMLTGRKEDFKDAVIYLKDYVH
jgi:hypothetical protein